MGFLESGRQLRNSTKVDPQKRWSPEYSVDLCLH